MGLGRLGNVGMVPQWEGLEVPSWPPSGHKATSVRSHTSASLSLAATRTVIRVPQAGGGLSLPERREESVGAGGQGEQCGAESRPPSRARWGHALSNAVRGIERAGETRPLSLPSGLPEGSRVA